MTTLIIYIKSLKTFYVNINGLNDQKLRHEIKIDTKDSDIICFTETHLKNEDDIPAMDDYNGYHAIVDRKITLVEI